MVPTRTAAWVLATIGTVLGLSRPARGGDEPIDPNARVEALRIDLRSEQPGIAAWAAYAAGREDRRILVPDLIRALAKRPGSWTSRHILDALIRLDAKVPMETLPRFPDRIETPVLILALRNGEEAFPLLHKALAQSFDGRRRIRASGVAAGNALVAARDRTVAALFLGTVEPEVRVLVVDSDRIHIGGGAVAMSGHGDGWCEVPEGFPPAVWYELDFQPYRSERVDARLLVRGPTKDVWYERWENPQRRFIIGDLSGRADTTEVGLGWAASLLGTDPAGLRLKGQYDAKHRWTGAKAYLAFLEEERQRVQRDVAAVLDGLIAAKLLTVQERERLVIRPRFSVNDDRDNKTEALPAIEDEHR